MRKLTKTEEEIVKRVEDLLDQDLEGWQKGWATAVASGMPYNAISKIKYKGVNAISLFLQGYDDPRWLTFNQIQEKGYHLEKGAKGALVEFWSRIDKDKRIVTEEYEQEKKKTLSEEEYEEWLKGLRMITRNYTVFNAQHVPELQKIKPVMSEEEKANQIETAETIIQNCFVPITYGGSRAYYSQTTDDIHLPNRESFFSQEEFYGTALHEMVHATGAKTRLARDMSGHFGTEQYAKEELVAELGSMFLQAELGVKMSEEHIYNHASYLQSWKKAIKNDPSYFIQAVTPAKNATDFVLGVAKVKQEDKKANSEEDKAAKADSNPNYTMTPEQYWKMKNLQSVNKCDKGIPDELKALNAWSAYKTFIDKDTGKRKKFIVDCHKPAKEDGSLNWAYCNKPETWSDYPTALKYARENGCVGLTLALTPELGYSCIDLDHVISEDGKMSDVAWAITEKAKDTYIERSTSGTGLHVFLKGSHLLDDYSNRNEAAGLEFYDKSKFISMTGDNFNGISSVSNPKEELIDYLKDSLKKKQAVATRSFAPTPGAFRTDDQVLDMIARSTKKNDFDMMFKAGVNIKGDESRTDASLVNLIYFYSEDFEQTKRLFMSSRRYRPEKGEKYVDTTVRFVINHIYETVSESRSKKPQLPQKSKSKGPQKSK